MTSDEGVFVPVTVLLELEWVTRALYGFEPEAFARVVRNLVGLPNVVVEDWPPALDAAELHVRGDAPRGGATGRGTGPGGVRGARSGLPVTAPVG